MDKPSKLSKYINSPLSNQKDYNVALDKDITNLFLYTRDLATVPIPGGTITGDIPYWDETDGAWKILHPGLSGQVLTTRGDGYAPYWAWVWQEPGAMASSERFKVVSLGASPTLDIIPINHFLNQGASLDRTYNDDAKQEEKTFVSAISSDIISMTVSISTANTLTTEHDLTVA